MKRLFLLIGIVFIIGAFSVPEGDSFINRAMRNMLRLVKMRPQEKVYLHTDRDQYEVGEKIWFRAYLTTSFIHQPSELSRFIYVELRDRQDSLYNRVKIPFQDSFFAGYMPLSSNLEQGEYFLRAYTYWMQNCGDEYIFRKKIRLLNPRNTKVQVSTAYERTEKGEVVRLRFQSPRKVPYAKVFVKCKVGDKVRIVRTDEEGNMELRLDSVGYGNKMSVSFVDENPFFYQRYIYLPDPRRDFEVSFMPEGGNLLGGCQQMVAFKAIGTDGLSREVEGTIFNDKGEQVGWIKSMHKGMGAVNLNIGTGRRYYAMLSLEGDTVQKRFDLPAPRPDAVALKVVSNADKLAYMVLAGDSVNINEQLYLLVHSRGVPVLCQPVRIGGGARLNMKDLPEGIIHMLLLDSKGEMYSERLCFINKMNRPEITIETDKESYLVRDGVNVQFTVRGDSTAKLSGSFSVAVTDDSNIERDTLQGNILTYFLLTSDLKGYIEEPAFYVQNNRVSTRRLLDLLMLTQGWTRFDVPQIVNGGYDSLKYYAEKGQAISGKVKNFWGKDATNANLVLLGTNGTIRVVGADSAGHFMIDGITFPENTKFVLQARSKKGRRSVEVIVDRDEFLEPSLKLPFGQGEREKLDDFYKRFQKDFFYDNGIKVYVLDEATVTKKVISKESSIYGNVADYTLDSAKLASYERQDLKQVLQEIPGIDAWGDPESVMYHGKKLCLILNDFQEEWSYIQHLVPIDLINISFVRPPLSVSYWGEAAQNGALVFTTNPHFVSREINKPSLVTFSLLGYQKKAEFYMPHYEVDSVRMALADTTDQRVTIYWNPKVETDASGRASCFFNTADSYGPYTLTIEGILEDGTVCRKEKKIRLKSLK